VVYELYRGYMKVFRAADTLNLTLAIYTLYDTAHELYRGYMRYMRLYEVYELYRGYMRYMSYIKDI